MNSPHSILSTSISLLLSVSSIAGSLIEPGAELELISDDFEMADGPAWNGSHLIFPDVRGEKIYQFDPKSGNVNVLLDNAGRISAGYYNNGRLYLSENSKSRISWLNDKNQIEGIAGQDPDAKSPARPNDLVVDDQGGIYYTLTRQGQVVYISPDGSQSVAASDIASPNGLILSPDQKTLYVSSTGTKRIWSFELTGPGQTGPGIHFASMDSGPDKGPDGMCIDRAGNVYCAGPKHVWIWSPTGELLEKIETPERPINCAFGDSDMRSLYIAGFSGLHRIRMNTYGVPQNPPAQKAYLKNNPNRPSTVIPKSIDSSLNIVYGRDGDRELLCDIFRPVEAKAPLPAILIVHGGGWRNGSKNKFRALAIELAKKGFVTAAIEYRLAHEAKFPAGAQDCNAATSFIRANAHRFGIDPTRIGAVGGSAGGHLVGLMATGWENPNLHRGVGLDPKSSRLDVAIVMGGSMQTTTGSIAARSRDPNSGSNSNLWLNATIDENPDLYRLADAHLQIDANDPPVFFLEGEFDKPERNEASRQSFRSLGIATGLEVYKDGKHGCWNLHPWFAPMVDDMAKIFAQHL